MAWCLSIYLLLPVEDIFDMAFFGIEQLNDLALIGYYLYDTFSLYLLFAMFFLLLALILAIFLAVDFIKKHHYDDINGKIRRLFKI